jgi:uncharacterized membrane protein
MSITKIIILYFLTVPVFFAIDMTWLGLIAKDFYKGQIGFLMRTDIIWWAAILFYLLFIVGIIYYAVLPAHAAGDWTKALLYGAFFGFFTYMTYDLTNYSTLKDWPLALAIVDTLWGTVLSASVATVSFFIAQKFLS